MSAVKIVALGGGHGLYTMLTALRSVTTDLTAVVTVADDGGSSGRIRREFDVLPPGDLRMALAALSGPTGPDQAWAELYQHRLGGTGVLAGHSVGNLVLTGLFERVGDPVAALDFLGRSLGAVGRVLPMSEVPLDLVATIEPHDRDDPVRGRRIRGQSAIASSPGRVREIAIRPADAPACRAATDAVRAADVVVLGPGSWFTSVLPHLLLPEMARAVVETRGRVVVTLNLVPQPGETDGFSPAEYLHVLRRYCPDLRVDAVIADENHSTSSPDASDRGSIALTRAAAGLGAVLVLADLCEPDRDDRHRPEALAAAMRLALERASGPAGATSQSEPDLNEHDSIQPDPIETDLIETEPNLNEHDSIQPDPIEPEPDLLQPDSIQHDSIQHDSIQHDLIKHEVPPRLAPRPAPGNAGARR